jgi:hypothetical protein
MPIPERFPKGSLGHALVHFLDVIIDGKSLGTRSGTEPGSIRERKISNFTTRVFI